MASDWNEELEKYESGRNLKDDITDSFKTIFSTARVIVSHIPTSSTKHNDLDEIYDDLNSDGWKSGPQGYGYYRNGMKD
ncbi:MULTISPECIES: hypothetical protein [Lonsdalea]|uniref:Uncharacterized protein n=1 Tax=Lonsdalea populi TaxID=1172565 RepID=A0ABX9EMY0_9GAMM|nr:MULTISPECIES: hypothetical protein [Lonsdalea]RAT17291.1 hypothetical protein AU487_16040 [Lonsdalea populi]RAT22562.1 hypothetical protein AU488_11090 [Lonsdalea populi]RAT23661.1 hypothetical protein AU489_10900 [Lonsdalea populi]RAT32509.1 hypothetical protein AU492_12350 [Lonsdalea populi]